ncbi:retrovirus-related Pol polyprotein from transposon TNT 1-94 [Trichonephila clavipes]|nr:retrovirus-related Pol polyprotein from transposon TNT 1-94 [Trichonephila clavipes]
MNSVASTLNRVTDMEFNNQISVLTPNNWNTWKHDMQVLLMHYGCWQFIIQTKPEQPDEEATYKEKLDLQLRKDRCYTLIYTNISSDLKNLITETTDGVAAWKILKDHFEPVTRARVIQLLDQFFGTKYLPGEDVGIFISRVKTAATRLQEAGHKLDDMYIGFQLIRWLPQEFQSTVQQIYRWKEEDFRVVKIEAELILEANRLQLMKQDLEKAENAYLSSFTSKKSKTLPGATAAAHGDPNGKNDYQKKGDLKPITNMKMSLATEDKSCPVEGIGTLRFRVKYKGSFHEITLTDVLFNPKLRRNLLSGSRLESKGAHFVGTKGDCISSIRNKSDVFHTFIRFQKRAERFLSKKVIAVRTDGGLEFCNKDMDNFLTELGIKHEVTNSYTPEMNGVAERFNLTTLDGIKTLLKSSEVPHKFWGEALLCFTYAWNRICHKDSNKTPFEKYSGRKPSVLHLIPFGCLAYAGVPKQIRKKFDMRAKMGIMMGYAQRTKGYRIWLIDENKLVETINFQRQVRKRPQHLKKPGVSSDNHNLMPCTEVKWIRNIGRKVTGSNVYYSIEGEATRLKSFNEIERYCKRHNIEYDPSLFNFRKDNTESQGFSDLSEQQEALMVEVTIPNCYKQAIRSRDASKWHDAMDKEINVMKERKVWDLVDHPDNIKILENRWVYTIKYDENNKIVRYKARLVARDTVIYMKQPTGYEIDNNKVYSDFATNRDDRVSMGGFITFIDETPISWRTFKQKSVSLSTMEAERFSQGQSRTTTSADDRCFLLCAQSNKATTPAELRSSLTASSKRLLTRSIVRRRLHKCGFYARQLCICAPFTSRHRRERLQWARQHIHWTRDQWSAVLFAGEFRFSLESDSKRVFIWREPGTRFLPWHIRPHSFTDYILDAYVHRYAEAVSDASVLQNDNARPPWLIRILNRKHALASLIPLMRCPVFVFLTLLLLLGPLMRCC